MPVLWISAFSVVAAVFAVDRPELAERPTEATEKGNATAPAASEPMVAGGRV
jgi:hypothetical protein